LPPSARKTTANGLGLIILATVATVLIAGFLMGNAQFRELLDGVEAYSDVNRIKAMAVFVCILALVVMLLFPGLIFTLLAGYLFGPVFGTLVVLTGTVIGACIAFTLARKFFSGYFRKVLQNNPTFSVIAESIAHDGWKTVMLTRTIPLFPFKLSNYCFGVIPVSLLHFAAGTTLGIIPLTITNVSIGALAADIDGLLTGNTSLGAAQYSLIALGIITGLGTFLLVRKRARQKFAQIGQQRTQAPKLTAYDGSPG
jgi:uncharacterized membrane protein YdjX (TVP38/TMEM64 family)